MDTTLRQELHSDTDHHEVATDARGPGKGTETRASEEVHEADGEEDEQVDVAKTEERGEAQDESGVVVRAEDRMDVIATEKGKEMDGVEDVEGEEEAVEEEEEEHGSEHDDSNGSEQAADDGETKQAGADVEEDVGVVGHDGSGRIEQDGAGDEEGQAGTDAGKHAKRVGGQGTATPQGGVETEGSPRLKPACSPETTAAGCADEVAAAQATPHNSAKGTRILRQLRSHPQAPAKKSHKSQSMQHAVPVASPSRSMLGTGAERSEQNAVTNMARDSSVGRRSRSPREGTDPGRAGTTEKQRAGKARLAKLKPTAAQGKAAPVITSPTAGYMNPLRSRSVPAQQTRCGQRVESSGGQILEEHLDAKKKQMAELALKNDFTGAAAAQEHVKELEALAEKLRAMSAKMNELAVNGDYMGAAGVQQEIKATENQIIEKFASKNDVADDAAAQAVAHEMKTHEEQLVVLKKRRDGLATKKDFVGAAAVQNEIEAMEVKSCEEQLQDAFGAMKDSTGGTVESNCGRILEEKLIAKKTMMEEHASKNDFVAAATAQEGVKELEALAEKLRAKKAMMDEFSAREEYMRAADAQQEIQATEQEIMEKFASKNDFADAADAWALAQELKAQKEQLASLKKAMAERAASEDYTGAAAAQEKIKETEEQIMEKVASKNKLADAAAAEALAQEMKANKEQLASLKKVMAECAAREDFKGAAAAQEEIKAREKHNMEKFASKNDVADAAADQAVAHEMKVQEEQLAELKKTIEDLVAKNDFRGAAKAKEQKLELERILSALVARAKGTGHAVLKASDHLETQIRWKTRIMTELASQENFVGAAAAKAEVDALTKSRTATTTLMPPLPSRVSRTQHGPKGGLNTHGRAGRGQAFVSLENLRVLSSSKRTSVPARTSRKGVGKKGGGRKGGGKKGLESAWEDFAAIYLGCINTKQIYHVLAYGELVEKISAYIDLDGQPIVNASNFERRVGKEELFCTSDTVITTCLERTDDRVQFAYDVSQVTKHLATHEFGTQAPLGQFVDVVLRINSSMEMPITSGANIGANYLQVSGVDMDGVEVGPLRLWNHVEGDVEVGTTCILRGLKVASERKWNGEKYVNNPDGARKFECDPRTAIEDVSDQPEITSYFD